MLKSSRWGIINSMDERVLKRKIRTFISEILREKVEDNVTKKPKDKKRQKKKAASGEIRIAKGAVGSGAFKRWVKEGGARAEKEPKKLMADLGVKSGTTGDDLQQALRVLRTALNFHSTMRESYGGVREIQEKLPNGETVKVLAVYMAGLDDRNGKKFLSHTLVGAKRAGFLNLQGGLEIGRGQTAPIVIYSV